MPKNRKVTKIDNVIKKQNVPSKHRIGNRKTGISAFLMSIKDLQNVLTSKDKKRWHNIARAEINKRSV